MREDDQARLSRLMQAEEAQRRAYHEGHAGACVPWRGAGGDIGRCIYCGKPVDPITAYYSDRAASSLANRAR